MPSRTRSRSSEATTASSSSDKPTNAATREMKELTIKKPVVQFKHTGRKGTNSHLAKPGVNYTFIKSIAEALGPVKHSYFFRMKQPATMEEDLHFPEEIQTVIGHNGVDCGGIWYEDIAHVTWKLVLDGHPLCKDDYNCYVCECATPFKILLRETLKDVTVRNSQGNTFEAIDANCDFEFYMLDDSSSIDAPTYKIWRLADNLERIQVENIKFQ